MRSRRRRKMAWSADVSPATGGLNLDFQRSTEFGGEEESEVWDQVVSLPLRYRSRRAASSGEFETKSTFQSAGESDLVVLAEVGDHGEGVVTDLLEEVTNR